MAAPPSCGTERRLCRHQVLRKLSDATPEEPKEPETGNEEPAVEEQEQEEEEEKEEVVGVVLEPKSSASPNDNPAPPPSV
jgi:hypothetical protein